MTTAALVERSLRLLWLHTPVMLQRLLRLMMPMIFVVEGLCMDRRGNCTGAHRPKGPRRRTKLDTGGGGGEAMSFLARGLMPAVLRHCPVTAIPNGDVWGTEITHAHRSLEGRAAGGGRKLFLSGETSRCGMTLRHLPCG
ncbi:unnamed protein product [Lampetra planeri]